MAQAVHHGGGMTQFTLALFLVLQAPVGQVEGPATTAAPVAQVEGPTTDAAAQQLEVAEARYRAAIALDPTIVAYHTSLAQVLERQGRTEEAIETYRRALAMDSLSSRTQASYGALLLRIGRTEEAVPHLAAAARLDPDSREVAARLAEARGVVAAAPASIERGYHDYSGFADDSVPRWTVVRVLELVFAAVLGLSTLALVGPLVGAVGLLALQGPQLALRQLRARRR